MRNAESREEGIGFGIVFVFHSAFPIPHSPFRIPHFGMSRHRSHRALERQSEGLGTLAADQDPGAVGEMEPHAAIAAGIEHALAIAAVTYAPTAVVDDRTV